MDITVVDPNVSANHGKHVSKSGWKVGRRIVEIDFLRTATLDSKRVNFVDLGQSHWHWLALVSSREDLGFFIPQVLKYWLRAG